jgi:hypothetical protein
MGSLFTGLWSIELFIKMVGTAVVRNIGRGFYKTKFDMRVEIQQTKI